MSTLKIRRATPAEKMEYTGMYPLYGYVEGYDADVLVPVEDLRGTWSRENPQYEAVLPNGWEWKWEYTSTLLAFTLADLRDQLKHTAPERVQFATADHD